MSSSACSCSIGKHVLFCILLLLSYCRLYFPSVILFRFDTTTQVFTLFRRILVVHLLSTVCQHFFAEDIFFIKKKVVSSQEKRVIFRGGGRIRNKKRKIEMALTES